MLRDNSIYTDLDSLLDTRAVLLAALTKQGKYDCNIKSEDYHSRMRDNFGTISEKIFNYYYEKRNSSLLNHANLTHIPDVIKDYIFDMLDVSKHELDFTIYINIHPYELNHEESEVFLNFFKKVFPKVNIIFIDLHYKEITPDWVKDKVRLLVFYDGLKWMQRFTEQNNGPVADIYDTILLAPCIINTNIETKGINNKIINDISQLFKVILKFDFLDCSMFSTKLE